VTGKLDTHTYALVFDALETVHGRTLDLWRYADFAHPESPVKMMLGRSNICATRKDASNHPQGAESRFRDILAVARLTQPYCTLVR